MTEDTKHVVKRTEGGQFVKGQSGNPAGKVKGTKNRITLARLMLEENLRATLEGAGPKLLRKAIKMALKGDEKIMRALLDKMLATPRGDDDGTATDRDVRVIIQNLTGPSPMPAIEGTVVRHAIQGTTKTHHEQGIQPAPDGSGPDADLEVVGSRLHRSVPEPRAGEKRPASGKVHQ